VAAATGPAAAQPLCHAGRSAPCLPLSTITPRPPSPASRSNPWSVHEVHVDEEQLAFFRRQLERTSGEGRPVVVFTHAPVLGSGLKVVQTVHVKNRWARGGMLGRIAGTGLPGSRVAVQRGMPARPAFGDRMPPWRGLLTLLGLRSPACLTRCAWLNHSSNPHEFMELVQRHPNVRLWFRWEAGGVASFSGWGAGWDVGRGSALPLACAWPSASSTAVLWSLLGLQCRWLAGSN
jgi:hypothetical protein